MRGEPKTIGTADLQSIRYSTNQDDTA